MATPPRSKSGSPINIGDAAISSDANSGVAINQTSASGHFVGSDEKKLLTPPKSYLGTPADSVTPEPRHSRSNSHDLESRFSSLKGFDNSNDTFASLMSDIQRIAKDSEEPPCSSDQSSFARFNAFVPKDKTRRNSMPSGFLGGVDGGLSYLQQRQAGLKLIDIPEDLSGIQSSSENNPVKIPQPSFGIGSYNPQSISQPNNFAPKSNAYSAVASASLPSNPSNIRPIGQKPAHASNITSGFASKNIKSPEPNDENQPLASKTSNSAIENGVPSSLPCYLVQFTSGRTDTFYVPPDANSGANGKQFQPQFKVIVGDYVVVEADRGEDLGRVIMDNINVPMPRRKAGVGNNSLENVASGMENLFDVAGNANQANASNNALNSANQAGVNATNLPKRIYRLASAMEVESLLRKARDEMNAITVGQYKVQEWKLPMVIIDSEYQWDRRKLTFFFSVTLPQYYPNQPSPRIDFRTLVRDLYQIYRTRIWMYCVDKENKANAMAGTDGKNSNGIINVPGNPGKNVNRAHNREKFLKQLQKDAKSMAESNGGMIVTPEQFPELGDESEKMFNMKIW